MAKIDFSKIEGWDKMTPEQKLKALESYETPDPDYSGYVKKEVFDKTASELAEKKKELTAKMTEDEKQKQADKEAREDLEKKYNALLHESQVSKFKAKLLGMGYEDKLADATAEAMANGDTDTVFANQQKHLAAYEKKIKAEVLKSTPPPVGDGDKDAGMTLEKLRKLSLAEREAFARNHADEYKALYTGESSNKGGNT